MKNSPLFISLFLFFVLIFPASAETGSVSIDAQYDNSYSVATGAAGKINLPTTISFYSSGFNRIKKIIYNPASATYSLEADGTNCHIVSGGIGDCIVSYTKGSNEIIFTFQGSTGATITSSTITLSYDKTLSVQVGDRSFAAIGAGDATLDTNHQLFLNYPGGFAFSGSYYAQTFNFVTNNYAVTYNNSFTPPYFNFSIDKTPSTVATKVTLTNTSGGIYYAESTFNTNPSYFEGEYRQGIVLNLSIQTGDKSIITINSSGGVLPTPELTPNPQSGVGIRYDKKEYIINDNINMSWVFSDSRWSEFGYKRIDISINGNEVEAFNIGSQTGYFVFPASEIGEVLVVAKTCIIACADIYTAKANIRPESNSWITLSNSTQNIFGYTNVTYHIGYSTSGYMPGLITIEVRDKSNGNLADVAVPSVFPDGTVSICGTSNSTRTCQEGVYSVELKDALKGVTLDKKTLTVFRRPDALPKLGILISNVTTDKSYYFIYDFMTVNYVIDDVNFTNYSIRGEIYNNNKSITTKAFYQLFANQTGQFDTRIDNNPNQKCEQAKNCWVDIGLNSFRIIAYNSTTSFIIATSNFTASSTTTDGYGLIVSTTTPAKGEAFTIKTIVPGGHTGTLKIADAGYANNFSLVNQIVQTGTNTFPITISRVNSMGVGYYDVLLYGDDAILKVKIPITVTTKLSDTEAAKAASEKKTTDIIDAWVGYLGLGVNDTSRFLFSVIWIVVLGFLGLVGTKNNLWGAIVMGFFPFAFFAWIAYIPHWVIVVAVILMALKVGWFK